MFAETPKPRGGNDADYQRSYSSQSASGPPSSAYMPRGSVDYERPRMQEPVLRRPLPPLEPPPGWFGTRLHARVFINCEFLCTVVVEPYGKVGHTSA